MLSYEAKFCEWARSQGFMWRELNWLRSSGGKVSAVSVTHPPQASRRGLILTIHATGNDKLYPLTHTLRVLLSAGFDVFSFDLDGHGRKSSTTLSLTDYTSMLPEALENIPNLISYKELYLYGQSLGGAIAIDFLSSRHELTKRVSACVCIATPHHLNTGALSVFHEMLSPLGSTFWRRTPEYGTYVIPAFGPFRRGVFPIRVDDNKNSHWSFSYTDLVSSILSHMNLTERANQVNQPILLLSGERDRIAPVQETTILSHVLGNASVMTLPGENHFSMLLSKEAAMRSLHWLNLQ